MGRSGGTAFLISLRFDEKKKNTIPARTI